MSESINININQSVAVLIDGNNIEISLQALVGKKNALVDFDLLIPKLLNNRGLSRLIYFREGKSISTKLEYVGEFNFLNYFLDQKKLLYVYASLFPMLSEPAVGLKISLSSLNSILNP
ncbi:MAG: hypothetical protein AAF599_13780 [Bacteroidota bacterium]